MISMLLTCCTLLNVGAAGVTSKAESPVKLKAAIDRLLQEKGDKKTVQLFTPSNPTTGIKKSCWIVEFDCDKSSPALADAIYEFESNDMVGYKKAFVHPDDAGVFKEVMEEGKTFVLRSKGEHMWTVTMKNPESPLLSDVYGLALKEGSGGKVNGRVFHVTSERDDLPVNVNVNTPRRGLKKFVLEGMVDAAIADSCYNIYMTDMGSPITDADMVACVPVVDKKFRFETELDEIKKGRIRAIFPGDKLCSAWIDIYFVPGLIEKISIHDGYYDFLNRTVYNDAIRDYMMNSDINVEYTPAHGSLREPNIGYALDSYQRVLNNLNNQLDGISNRDDKDTQEFRKRLYQQILDVTEKMKNLLDGFSEEL